MKHINARRWLIWSLAVAFYFYEYFLRVAPSVMVKDLFQSFQIGAGVLGTMVAFYLYAYAPMQLPAGILMDRYGARKLLTLATLGCGFASILFGIAHEVWVAEIARLLTGAGSAFAFIGMVYICSHWFSQKILGLLVGIGNSIGMLGAVFGEGPLSMLVDAFSWRPTMIGLGIVGLILALVIYISMLREPPEMENHSPALQEGEPLLKSLKTVCKNGQTWINGIVSLCFYTATVAYGGLWAIPFLVQAHGFSNEAASYASSMIYVGWIVAGPIIGHISDKICNRKIMLFIFTLVACGFFLLITFLPNMPAVIIFILFFLLGCALAAQLLTYSLAIELNTPETKGTALALTNFLVFVGGSIIQTLIGWLLDYNWSGEMKFGAPVYSLENFQISLLPFPISIILAFIFTFFIKEKNKPWCPQR